MNIVHYEDVQVGSSSPRLTKGPMTASHIMRWSAAMENWHRIHYDYRFAPGHDKLPDVLINGSWKQHILVQVMKEALGSEGWLWKIKFRYQKMDIAGDTLHAQATAVDKKVRADLGFVTYEVSLTDQNDKVSTSGLALGVLPLKGGPKVPYPFVVKPEFADLGLRQ